MAEVSVNGTGGSTLREVAQDEWLAEVRALDAMDCSTSVTRHELDVAAGIVNEAIR
jgi:hypothetical protein